MGEYHFDDMDDIVEDNYLNNMAIEFTLRQQNKIPIASHYVIKWNNMSVCFRISTILVVILILFIILASVGSMVLIPFVASNSDSENNMNVILQDNSANMKVLNSNVTYLNTKTDALSKRISGLEKDNACYRDYIKFTMMTPRSEKKGVLSKDTTDKKSPEQKLISCLGSSSINL